MMNQEQMVIFLESIIFIDKYQLKDCSSKFRSKHSSNTVLCLLRNLLEQSL